MIDFSSWCSNFRYKLATPVFHELDNIFGLKQVFVYTHVIPMECVQIFQDRYSPPHQNPQTKSPSAGPRCKHAIEAWLEELQQKGWTLLTTLMILDTAYVIPAVASLLGQGDNQVVCLRIPKGKELEKLNLSRQQYIKRFLNSLIANAEECGMEIKKEETCVSSDLFEYARHYNYKGSQVSCAIKRITRIASEANQTVPVFNGDLSRMFSTGATAAGEDHKPDYSYLTTCVEALHHIRREFSWLKEQPLGVSTASLLVSRVLGGLPISLYAQFCIRGIQDPLPSNSRLLQTAMKDNLLRPFLGVWASLTPKRGAPDYLSLIKDPVSLPLSMPPQPEWLQAGATLVYGKNGGPFSTAWETHRLRGKD